MTNDTQRHPPVEHSDHQSREHAQRIAQQRRAFHIHATVFTASMLAIALVNAALNAAAGIMAEWWAWWSVLALLGWGLGLSIHGIVVRLARPQPSRPLRGEGQLDECLPQATLDRTP